MGEECKVNAKLVVDEKTLGETMKGLGGLIGKLKEVNSLMDELTSKNQNAKLVVDEKTLDETMKGLDGLIGKLKEVNSLMDELTSKNQNLERNVIANVTTAEFTDVVTNNDRD